MRFSRRFHASYDAILKNTEYGVFIPKLRTILDKMNASVAKLDAQYNSVPAMLVPLHDVDVFITVRGRSSRRPTVAPYYSENSAKVGELLNDIKAEAPAPVQLFARFPGNMISASSPCADITRMSLNSARISRP